MSKLPALMGIIFLLGLLAGCQEKPGKNQMTDQETDEEFNPPSSVTREVFLQWRDARRGESPAESMTNPYWVWLIESEISSYGANQLFDGPSSYGGSPAWSRDRFGQSDTTLPDGRRILIAGEHEDYHDPDFYIYNDVFVISAEGDIEILGYPASEFPPTDFHTATLLGEDLILVGSLGYPDDRKPATTQVLVLNTESWEVTRKETGGNGPGWIHRHRTELTEDRRSLIIRGGLVSSPDQDLIENIDDWKLDLASWQWSRLTDRQWPLWDFEPADGESNQLWEMRHALWEEEFGKPKLDDLGMDLDDELRETMKEMMDHPLPKDREALATLYQPEGLEFETLPENEDEFNIHRIRVEGVVVRYQEDSSSIRMTVEGKLADRLLDKLVSDLKGKLERIEGKKYQPQRLR